MSSSEAVALYRLYAGHCIEIARQVPDPGNKTSLFVLAQAWLALADQAEKYGETALIYETSLARTEKHPQPPEKPEKE